MLPVSIVDRVPFKEFLNKLDPSFNVPNRKTIKDTLIPSLRHELTLRLQSVIKSLEYPNVSMRCYNGYIAQGIDTDWNLRQVTLAFERMEGRHTGANIKSQFDQICNNFNLDDRVFKIISDQAANMKAAMKEKNSADSLTEIALSSSLRTQKRLELAQKREVEARCKLEKEIDSANASTPVESVQKSVPMKAAQLIDNWVFDQDDSITEEQSDDDDSDDSSNDVDSFVESDSEDQVRLNDKNSKGNR